MRKRKQYIGRVISDKMDKTVVVGLERLMMHPLYKKSVRRTKRVKCHDKRNECSIGDIVRIEETRPISKEKNSRVVEIIERAK